MKIKNVTEFNYTCNHLHFTHLFYNTHKPILMLTQYFLPVRPTNFPSRPLRLGECPVAHFSPTQGPPSLPLFFLSIILRCTQPSLLLPRKEVSLVQLRHPQRRSSIHLMYSRSHIYLLSWAILSTKSQWKSP